MNTTLTRAVPNALITYQPSISDSAMVETPLGATSSVIGAGPSMAEIASLSTVRIMEMTRADLADVIRKVRMRHLRPGVLEQLSRMDGATLRRLVFATRRYCRSQALLSEGILPSSTTLGHFSH